MNKKEKQIQELKRERNKLLEQRKLLIEEINKIDDRNSLKLQLFKNKVMKIMGENNEE